MTRRPQSLNVWIMSFLALSDWGPDSLKAARRSSLYRPTWSLLNLEDSRWRI